MKRMYYSFDTKEMPGKVVMQYVEFGTEIATIDEKFKNRTFDLVDPRDPRVKKLFDIHKDKLK